MARKYSLASKSAEAAEDSPLLETLNPAQKEAARHVQGPLLILAGAGSGKTRVMTHRIAFLISEVGVHPEQILAMTFTNKACDEMRERVDDILGEEAADESSRVTISTFHSLCARLLRWHAKEIGLTPDFVIYDDTDQRALIKRLMEQEDRGKERSEIRRLRNVIESFKNRGLTPEQAHETAFDQAAEEDVFFYELYQDALREANCLDFGDLILAMLEVFRQNPDIAKSYSNQWRYVMVDEFQDTNPAQYELLQHLTTEHDNLAVVGDDDQAIYRWRGATVANILGFEDHFDDAKVVKLEQNYRSTQVILDAANDVIRHNDQRREKTLWTEESGGAKITCYTARDDRGEALWVAQEIEKIVRGGRDHADIAVFYRTNAQGRAFEEQLRFAGIPYQLVGGMSFYARSEIKDLMAYLKVALNPTNEVDLLRVINTPTRGVGKTTLEKLMVAGALPGIGGIWGAVKYVAGSLGEVDSGSESGGWLPGMGPSVLEDPALADLDNLRSRTAGGVTKFHDIIQSLQDDLETDTSLAQLVRRLIERIAYLDHLRSDDPERAEDRARNVGELVNAIDEFEREQENLRRYAGVGDDEVNSIDVLRAFLDRSSLVQTQDQLEDVGAVTLMTIHGSKGLEFDTVFIAGMEDEIFPSVRDGDPEELDEERRLAYVAITRAERKLYMTNAQRRRVYGQFRNTSPSRFVLDIDPSRVEVHPASVAGRRDYSGRGQWGATGCRVKRGRSTMSPDNSMWEFDQSPEEVRSQIGNALSKLKRGENVDEEIDEFSQLTEYEDFEEESYDVSHWGLEDDEDLDGGDLVGCTVSHPKFGIGSIKAVSGTGDKAKVTVNFPTAGEKKVIRKFLKVLG